MFSGETVAKREGFATQANQDVEELASSVQGCTLARDGAGDGGPHGTTAPTSATLLGTASDCTLLKLPDGSTIRFGNINWGGVQGHVHKIHLKMNRCLPPTFP